MILISIYPGYLKVASAPFKSLKIFRRNRYLYLVRTYTNANMKPKLLISNNVMETINWFHSTLRAELRQAPRIQLI